MDNNGNLLGENNSYNSQESGNSRYVPPLPVAMSSDQSGQVKNSFNLININEGGNKDSHWLDLNINEDNKSSGIHLPEWSEQLMNLDLSSTNVKLDVHPQPIDSGASVLSNPILNNNNTIENTQNSNDEKALPISSSAVQTFDTPNERKPLPQIDRMNKENPLDKGTWNEPILTTMKRDWYLIWIKLKYVINPYVKEEDRNRHIRQWDLWGPLLFTMILALTWAYRAAEKSHVLAWVFAIYWIGAFLVYLNANLWGAKISIFQIYCLLGYCLAPLDLVAIILSIGMFYEFLRITIIIIGVFWASFSMSGFLRSSIGEEKKELILYPAILIYMFLSGVILMNRFE